MSGNSRATCTKAYTSESVAAHSAAMRRPLHRGGAPTEHVARKRRAIRRPFHRGGVPTESVAAQICRYPPSPSQHNVKGMLPRVASLNEMRQRPTLPYSVPYSTIGSMWLNFRVRYENGWIPHDIITAMVYHLTATQRLDQYRFFIRSFNGASTDNYIELFK